MFIHLRNKIVGSVAVWMMISLSCPRLAGVIRSVVPHVSRSLHVWTTRAVVESLALGGVLCAWLLPLGGVRGLPTLRTGGRRRHDAAVQVGALGKFELARDEDDTAV